MDHNRVSKAVHEVLGSHADETILEYLCGILEDEHFPWDEAYDHVGPIMVSWAYHATGPQAAATGAHAHTATCCTRQACCLAVSRPCLHAACKPHAMNKKFGLNAEASSRATPWPPTLT